MAAERVSRRLLLALGLGALAMPAGATMSPAAEQALDRGLRHLYSLDYAQARSDFRHLIEREPDNPFGYLFESGAIWWQSSQEYGLFKDTPTLQGLFEQDVDMAIKKAEPMTQARDRGEKVDGHFVEGMALGTRGQWSLMRGRYLKAYFDAKSAIRHLKKVPKLDPGYRDVDLGLGVYDYQMAHLSGVAKLSGLLGVRGDERKGLELLRSAMDRARYSSLQAAEFLAMIYILDKRDWAAALPVVQKLRESVPESVYFDSLGALVYWKLGQKDASLAIGRAMFEKAKADPAAWDRKLLSLACGLTAERCLDRDEAAGLREWLTAALEAAPAPRARGKASKRGKAAGSAGPDDTEAYLTLLHLYRGYASDALGRTDAAAADYAWVLEHRDFADARARAQECQENGCAAREVLLYLRRLTREEAPSGLATP